MAKIMVVDDDAAACLPIVKHLEAVGHEVKCCPNGREALAAVLAELPDAVVLDLMMPEMDGPTFLEVVRSYLRLQTLPVVVLTGLTDSPMVDRSRTLKVNTILDKTKASLADIEQAVNDAIVRLPG